MKTIWKCKISLEPIQQIEMPVGAKIVQFHKQGSRQEDDINIWFICETDEPKEKRTFALVETGSEIPSGCEYLGTIWLMNGAYVLHLFEIRKE